MLSNLRVEGEGSSVSFYDFILWNPDNYDLLSWSGILTLDHTGSAIKDDKGGNLKISGTFPS